MRTIRIFIKIDIAFELSFIWTNTALESMGKNKKKTDKDERERRETGGQNRKREGEKREKAEMKQPKLNILKKQNFRSEEEKSKTSSM